MATTISISLCDKDITSNKNRSPLNLKDNLLTLTSNDGMDGTFFSPHHQQDNCRQYMSCPVCFEDPQCGWCSDYNLCINGNSTGPNEGSCDWYYYQCPNNTTPTPTMSPSNISNTSWYQYGGNAQHTGYANYNVKLTSNSQYIRIFSTAVAVDFGFYSSSLAIANDTLFANLYSPGNADYLRAWSVSTNEDLWATQMLNDHALIDYSSGPSLTMDGQYVISICGGTQFHAIFQTLVSAANGSLLDEQTSMKLMHKIFSNML